MPKNNSLPQPVKDKPPYEKPAVIEKKVVKIELTTSSLPDEPPPPL